MQFSVYERANKRLNSMNNKHNKKKTSNYSLANDLSVHFKVSEWKKNPNYNKFYRQMNSHSPMRNAKLIDWKTSIIKSKVDSGQTQFNQENDSRVFKEDEIEYMINLLRYSTKEFNSIDLLKPLFNKSLLTLEKIMEELMLGHVFDRIQIKLVEISPENTMKILIRCKMMFYCRNEMINILNIIHNRE